MISDGEPNYGTLAGSGTDIQTGLNGISAVASLKNLATNAKLLYDKAVATWEYSVAYTGLYKDADGTGWNLGGQSLDDAIKASGELTGGLWGDCASFNTSMFGSTRGDDTLSKLLGASQTGLQNDLTLEKAQASNFGQYQINWRQQSSMSAGEKAKEVAWATNVKSARDSYFTALGDATTDFDDTLTGALGSYYDDMLEAQITRLQSQFDASKKRFGSLEKAMNAYSKASFEAAKEAAKKYLDAAVKQVVDNAKDEKDAREKEKEHYDGIADEQEDGLDTIILDPDAPVMSTKPIYFDPDDEDFLDDLQDGIAATEAWNTTFQAAAGIAKTLNASTQQQVNGRKNALNNKIAAAKSANENTRKETDTQTGKEYASSENTGWNAYYTAAIESDAKYLKDYKQSENTFNTAKKESDDAYTGTVTTGWLSYSKKMREYEALFEIAVAHAGDPSFNAGDWFNGGGQGDYLKVALKQQEEGANDDIGRDIEDWILDSKAPIQYMTDDVGAMIVEKYGEPTDPSAAALLKWEIKSRLNHAISETVKDELAREEFRKELQEEISADRDAIDDAVRTAIREFEEYQADKTYNQVSDVIHTGLDVAGFIPGFGELFDGINGVFYSIEGNPLDAALSYGAMIPFAGWGATGGKWGKRIYNAADTGGNLAGGAGHKITKNVLEHLSPEEAARVAKASQIITVTEFASKVSAKNKQIFRCVEFTEELMEALTKAGIPAEKIKIVSSGGSKWGNIFHTPSSQIISVGGEHWGVRVGDMVYDNLNQKGIIYQEWIKQFEVPRMCTITIEIIE